MSNQNQKVKKYNKCIGDASNSINAENYKNPFNRQQHNKQPQQQNPGGYFQDFHSYDFNHNSMMCEQQSQKERQNYATTSNSMNPFFQPMNVAQNVYQNFNNKQLQQNNSSHNYVTQDNFMQFQQRKPMVHKTVDLHCSSLMFQINYNNNSRNLVNNNSTQNLCNNYNGNFGYLPKFSFNNQPGMNPENQDAVKKSHRDHNKDFNLFTGPMLFSNNLKMNKAIGGNKNS